MKARKYEFYIIDREMNDEYEYIGYFEDDNEAIRFIVENVKAGNDVTVEGIKDVYVETLSVQVVVEIEL